MQKEWRQQRRLQPDLLLWLQLGKRLQLELCSPPPPQCYCLSKICRRRWTCRFEFCSLTLGSHWVCNPASSSKGSTAAGAGAMHPRIPPWGGSNPKNPAQLPGQHFWPATLVSRQTHLIFTTAIRAECDAWKLQTEWEWKCISLEEWEMKEKKFRGKKKWNEAESVSDV